MAQHQLSRTTAAHRVAVVGTGYWGKNLVRNFAELGALAAISDPNRQAAEELALRYGVPIKDFSEVLSDPVIAGVAIAAPAALHAKLSLQALEAGKHVFVEKPLALNLKDGQAVVDLAKTKALCLMVGHLLQFHPAFIKLGELARDGSLGRLQYLYSNRLNLGKVRREEDILWSFAPHDISMIISLVGQEPERITAEGSYHLHKVIADVTSTHLAFPGGEKAHVFVSWLHPFKEQKLVVIGDQAMAVFDDGEHWANKLIVYPHKIKWRDTIPVPQKAAPIPITLDEGEPLRIECQHFLECIETGLTPRTDGAEGMRVLRVLTEASTALGAQNVGIDRMTKGPSSFPKQKFPGVQIHESAYVDLGCNIGTGTKIWHFSHILGNTRIGQNCSLGQNVVVGPDVIIGDNCKIQNNVSIYKGVTLEAGVFCGPSCVFTNVVNPRAEIERKSEFRQTTVRCGASIGANATIVCGHDIGAYSFIAAGAVVTHDVPPFALMVGSPARRVGWISHAGEKLGPDLVCPREGRRYREVSSGWLEEIQESVGLQITERSV